MDYLGTDRKSCLWKQDKLFLYLLNVPHSFHARSPIRFGVLLIAGLPLESQINFNVLIQGGSPTIITLSQMDQELYEALFRQWLRVITSSLKEPEKSYQAWIQVLLLFLYERSRYNRLAISVRHAADYITQHLQLNLHISDLASLAGLSEEGFRKRFYKVYGMTPKQFHQMKRLDEAKWLLSASDKDMQFIADSLGFSYLPSFSTWFKKLEGTSPTEWRKEQRLYHQ